MDSTRGSEEAARELRILVAALTYKRPDDLAALVPALIAQAESAGDTCRVLVVDNDPDGGARDTVDAIGSGKLRYVHAAIPGIAAARNIAIDNASDFDLLVFIDDDERPSDGWLTSLLAARADFGSQAVVGPVISQFAHPPEDWIRAGRFFDRRRLPTGTPVDLVATNNLLLDLAWVRKSGIRFEEKFGLIGGSDTLFARRLHSAGAAMIWCDEAIVFDIVPDHRATRSWVMRRAFRSGNSWVRTSLELASTPPKRFGTRVQLGSRGALRVLAGAARITLGIVVNRIDLRARGARTAARGAGLVAGAVGSIYSEYKR